MELAPLDFWLYKENLNYVEQTCLDFYRTQAETIPSITHGKKDDIIIKKKSNENPQKTKLLQTNGNRIPCFTGNFRLQKVN